MLKTVFDIFRSIFRWARRSILLIGCIFFLTINVLTLTSGFVQSALAASLGAIGLTSTVYSTLASTIDDHKRKMRIQRATIQEQAVANRKLKLDFDEASKSKRQLLAEKRSISSKLTNEKKKTKKLAEKSKKLATVTEKLATKTTELAADHKQLKSKNIRANNVIKWQRATVKSLGGRVTSRTLKSVALNVGSIPAESLPVVGAAVVVIVTGYELHMACDNIKDMNQIYTAMGIPLDNDQGMATETCLGYMRELEALEKDIDKWANTEYVKDLVRELRSKFDIEV